MADRKAFYIFYLSVLPDTNHYPSHNNNTAPSSRCHCLPPFIGLYPSLLSLLASECQKGLGSHSSWGAGMLSELRPCGLQYLISPSMHPFQCHRFWCLTLALWVLVPPLWPGQLSGFPWSLSKIMRLSLTTSSCGDCHTGATCGFSWSRVYSSKQH